jgi:prevent-host-death family protein
MNKTVPESEAQTQFSRLLDGVAQNGDRVIIERHGRAIAAVVPMDEYQQMERARQELFELMDRAARNANLTPEEADALVAEEVRAARAEARRGA